MWYEIFRKKNKIKAYVKVYNIYRKRELKKMKIMMKFLKYKIFIYHYSYNKIIYQTSHWYIYKKKLWHYIIYIVYF